MTSSPRGFSILIGFLACLTLARAQFPESISKCKVTDEKCLIQQANTFLHTYRHGVPALGVEDMEPMLLGNIKYEGDKNGPASFDLQLTNAKLYNYTSLTVTSFKGFTQDLTKPMKLFITTTAPEMTIKAKYKASGRILILPITGNGDLEWVLRGVKTKSKIIVHPEVRADGKTYFKYVEYKLLTKMDNIHTWMTNLFGGNKELGDNMLKLINDNWEILSTDITPLINDAIAAWCLRNLNNFLGKIPAEEFWLN